MQNLGASHKQVKCKFSLPPCPARERCPQGNLPSPPLSLLSMGKLQQSRSKITLLWRLCNIHTSAQLENWQSPVSGPALRTRKKGGWVRGREGGETRGEEGRGGNQSLNLDTNLNRYCPSQSAVLMRQQAANSAAVPKLGDTMCAFSPSLSISPSYFYHPVYLFICLFLFPVMPLFFSFAGSCSPTSASVSPLFSLIFPSPQGLLIVFESDLFFNTVPFPPISVAVDFLQSSLRGGKGAEIRWQCLCTEDVALVPWSMAGTPRHNISSTIMLLGDSLKTDYSFAEKSAAQKQTQAQCPHARSHWLAQVQDLFFPFQIHFLHYRDRNCRTFIPPFEGKDRLAHWKWEASVEVQKLRWEKLSLRNVLLRFPFPFRLQCCKLYILFLF